ncbi:MAG TPA: hypothetical protein VK989_02205 [Polyangia bacterium]|nr:hypothetical protein [Polyangia bacterium]
MQTPGSTGHSASLAHGRHVFALMLQIGFVPEQSPFPTHWTQEPEDAHAGVPPPRVAQSVELGVQPRHTCVSQIGFVAAVQWVSAVHAQHWPSSQAGVDVPLLTHSLSVMHARHIPASMSQIGWPPSTPQLAFVHVGRSAGASIASSSPSPPSRASATSLASFVRASLPASSLLHA